MASKNTDNKQSSISGILCVYNEIQNIELIISNIRSKLLNELIIIDGGSQDGTYEILVKEKNIVIHQKEGVGLLAQRLYGIELASNDLIFLFNADDDLSLINFTSLADEMFHKSAHGLQLNITSPSTNYWEKAWSNYFKIIFPEEKKLPVLGRPCLTQKYLFDSIETKKNIFNEDTFLKYEQERIFGELNYYTSIQKVIRKVPKRIIENFIQFYKYGVSDEILSRGDSNKTRSLLFHSFVRIAVLRSFKMMQNRNFNYVFFNYSMGIIRGFSLCVKRILSWA
jgi:glycosyltransferase involved in cell wall biosynthesis